MEVDEGAPVDIGKAIKKLTLQERLALFKEAQEDVPLDSTPKSASPVPSASWSVVSSARGTGSGEGNGHGKGDGKGDGMGDGKRDNNGNGKGYYPQCSVCWKEVPCSELLLHADFLEQDKIGHLRGTCQGCSPEEFRGLLTKRFKKEVEKRYNERATRAGKFVTRYRSFSWGEIEKYIKEAMPKLAPAVQRELCKQRLKAVKAAFTAGLQKKNKHALQCYTVLKDSYLGALDAIAADPRNPSRADARTLRQNEAQYLTKFCEGVLVTFVCRQKSCGYFGDNATWIKHYTKHQFRYPPPPRPPDFPPV